MLRFCCALLLGAAALSSGGCATVRVTGKSPLAPPVLPRDSVAVEKYTIRFPHGEAELDHDLWSEVDEECLPAELRTRLAANGFRAGVVGTHLPAPLDRALRSKPNQEMEESPAPEAPTEPTAEGQVSFTPKPIDLLHEPTVRRSLWQSRPGQPQIVVMAGEQARIPRIAALMRGDDGRVSGRTFEKVLGTLSMKLFPESDGRVRVEIVPELEHGEQRTRYVAADGMIKPDYRPETEVFKDLRIDAVLAPGHALVLGTRADKPGSLGHHFFTEQQSARPLEQKLLMVRLAQVPADDRFATVVPTATAADADEP